MTSFLLPGAPPSRRTALGRTGLAAAFLALAFAGGEVGVEFLEHLVAGALDVDLQGLEHARGDAVAFAQQAEQDVLGADVGMIERLGFLAREGEDLLHARGVGDVARHLGVRAGADLLFHLDADGLQVEPELLQHVDRDALAELDQPEEQVLGAHVIMVEAVGFLARKREDLLGAGREIIHDFFFSPSIGLARAKALVSGSGTLLRRSRSRSERRPSRSSVVSLRS